VNQPKNRRRIRIIDREFQLGLAWRQMIAFAVFLLLGVAVMLHPSLSALTLGDGEGLKLVPAAREYLTLSKRVWPAVCVVMLGMFVYTALESHRIAGPVYHINAVLRQMIEGKDPEGVCLRQGDHLQATAELLDLLIKQRRAAASTGRDGPQEAEQPERETVEV
jgi:hypothetical protein